MAAVRLISETVGSLPLMVYRQKRDGSKEQVRDHWTYPLLHTSPNEIMTSMVWRETKQALLCTWGNCYSEMKLNPGQTRIEGFRFIPSSEVSPKWASNGNDVEYHIGKLGTKKEIVPRKKMFHVPGLGFNGLVGFSPIRMAKEAIGLGLAAEEFAARFFGKGAQPSGILEHPAELSEEAHDNLKKSFEEQQGGLENAWRPMILEQGMQWKSISMPMTEAQLLESRQFSVVEIARIFNLPPHLLRDLSKASFNNIEEENLHFAILSIRPWLVRWEQALKKQVFDRFGLPDMYAEFNLEGLLRGKQKDRYEAYRIGRNWGWLNVDEIRRLENMNPLPNGQGKHYLMPMNMWDVSRIDELPVGKGVGGAPPRSRYLKMLEQACQGLVKREINAARRQLKNGVEDFNAWIDQFYAQNVEEIRTEIDPVVDGYCDECQVEHGKAADIAAKLCSDRRWYLNNIIEHYKENEPVAALVKHYAKWRMSGAREMAGYIVNRVEEESGAIPDLSRL
jgi:HK97 family phage portal protein